jgi:CarD family transcriptional regulator
MLNKYGLFGGDALFQIGDKIVYPMHGAGVIEAVEEKEILGVKQYYYVLHITVGNMQVMIPVRKASDAGIRLIVDVMVIDDILSNVATEEFDPSLSWNKRQRVYMDKMRTGNIHDGVEVIRDIAFRSKNKNLSSGEKGVWTLASQIFISEMVLVKGITENQAVDLFDQMVRY